MMPQRLEAVSPAQRRDLEPLRPAIESTLGGFLPNSLFVMAHNPDLLLGFGALSRGVFRGSERTKLGGLPLIKAAIRQIVRSFKVKRDPPLSDALRALIFLSVSLSAGCRYCQAHSVTQAIDRGISQAKIDDILLYDTSPLYNDAERAVLAISFAAGEVPNGTTNAHFDALKAHFTTQQIVDVVAAIAYMGFLNRWNDTLATTLEQRPAELGDKALGQQGWQIGNHS